MDTAPFDPCEERFSASQLEWATEPSPAATTDIMTEVKRPSKRQQFISIINSSVSMLPVPFSKAFLLQSGSSETSRSRLAELGSSQRCGSETIWKLQCWKVSCEWRLQTLSQGQAIKICKWGPGERKWSGLLTLEQTTHITGGCMKIEVKETTVTFRAQKLSDNTFT